MKIHFSTAALFAKCNPVKQGETNLNPGQSGSILKKIHSSPNRSCYNAGVSPRLESSGLKNPLKSFFSKPSFLKALQRPQEFDRPVSRLSISETATPSQASKELRFNKETQEQSKIITQQHLSADRARFSVETPISTGKLNTQEKSSFLKEEKGVQKPKKLDQFVKEHNLETEINAGNYKATLVKNSIRGIENDLTILQDNLETFCQATRGVLNQQAHRLSDEMVAKLETSQQKMLTMLEDIDISLDDAQSIKLNTFEENTALLDRLEGQHDSAKELLAESRALLKPYLRFKIM